MLRYLKHTASYRLQLGGDALVASASSDSDWGNSVDDRRSVSGYVCMLGSGVVSWKAMRQKTVALSSTEAEYMSAATVAREVIWLRQLLSQLHHPQPTTTIYSDNTGCIALANNPAHHQRSKHIDVQYHYVREQVEAGNVQMKYVATEHMIADIMTKPLRPAKHERDVQLLGLSSHPASQSGSVVSAAPLSAC